MRFLLAVGLLSCEIATARPNCPIDLRNELPFQTTSRIAVELWSKHRLRLDSSYVEVIAVVAGDPVHFRPACEEQPWLEKSDQTRYLSIWTRSNSGWKMVAKSDTTLVPWDHVGEVTTELKWDELTLLIKEGVRATRLDMEYKTQVRSTKNGNFWQVIGHDSIELYNEYRISSEDARDDFDKKAEKYPTVSPYSGHKRSVNWLTGQASIQCYSFGEVPKTKILKFNLDLSLEFGIKSSDQKAATILKQLQCK